MGDPKIPLEKLPPEMLRAFGTFRGRHAPYTDPGSARCGKLNTSWWLTGQSFEGKFVVECKVCNYRMLVNPNTGELEHFDSPVEAMRNMLVWGLCIEDLLQGITGGWRKHIDETARKRAEESLPEAETVADPQEPNSQPAHQRQILTTITAKPDRFGCFFSRLDVCPGNRL